MSPWVGSGHEASGEETVHRYEVDTKWQVRVLSLWVRSEHEAAGEETESMGTKWTLSGK